MNTSMLKDRAKGLLHQAMAELKAGRLGVAVAEEGLVIEKVHRCMAILICISLALLGLLCVSVANGGWRVSEGGKQGSVSRRERWGCK